MATEPSRRRPLSTGVGTGGPGFPCFSSTGGGSPPFRVSPLILLWQKITTWYTPWAAGLCLVQARTSWYFGYVSWRCTVINQGATATGERSFSAMRQIKTYLRLSILDSATPVTMYNVMLLNVGKTWLTSWPWWTGRQFVGANEHRRRFFGSHIIMHNVSRQWWWRHAVVGDGVWCD